MRNKRTLIIYSLLAMVWALICVWQVAEHSRVEKSAQANLLNRTRNLSRTLGVVIQSQRMFGSWVIEERLERALAKLTERERDPLMYMGGSPEDWVELLSVACLNQGGDVVAEGGRPLEQIDLSNLNVGEAIWGKETLTVVQLADFGSSPTLVFSPPTGDRSRDGGEGRGDGERRYEGERREGSSFSNRQRSETSPTSPTAGFRSDGERRFSGRGGYRGRRGRPLGRPPWMSEEEFEELKQNKGLRQLVIQMSTLPIRGEIARDFWLRLALSGIALLAAMGAGVAWRGIDKSIGLQMRLVRAQEMNAYLREMNVAAAGMAHETRNPLNIIRGLAQMITKEPKAPAEVRDKSTSLIEEVDRVTSRLNAFIDYSKPREAKLNPTNIAAVIRDVERTLDSDREDKGIHFKLDAPDIEVRADESLLRQVIFNLLLNAYQAVEQGGEVEIRLSADRTGGATLEISDNGPGVPEESRQEIFRPYVTLNETGTGLGLAVVGQIVQAHHWEIKYVPSKNGGAAFRIEGLKVVKK